MDVFLLNLDNETKRNLIDIVLVYTVTMYVPYLKEHPDLVQQINNDGQSLQGGQSICKDVVKLVLGTVTLYMLLYLIATVTLVVKGVLYQIVNGVVYTKSVMLDSTTGLQLAENNVILQTVLSHIDPSFTTAINNFTSSVTSISSTMISNLYPESLKTFSYETMEAAGYLYSYLNIALSNFMGIPLSKLPQKNAEIGPLVYDKLSIMFQFTSDLLKNSNASKYVYEMYNNSLLQSSIETMKAYAFSTVSFYTNTKLGMTVDKAMGFMSQQAKTMWDMYALIFSVFLPGITPIPQSEDPTKLITTNLTNTITQESYFSKLWNQVVVKPLQTILDTSEEVQNEISSNAFLEVVPQTFRGGQIELQGGQSIIKQGFKMAYTGAKYLATVVYNAFVPTIIIQGLLKFLLNISTTTNQKVVIQTILSLRLSLQQLVPLGFLGMMWRSQNLFSLASWTTLLYLSKTGKKWYTNLNPMYLFYSILSKIFYGFISLTMSAYSVVIDPVASMICSWLGEKDNIILKESDIKPPKPKANKLIKAALKQDVNTQNKELKSKFKKNIENKNFLQAYDNINEALNNTFVEFAKTDLTYSKDSTVEKIIESAVDKKPTPTAKNVITEIIQQQLPEVVEAKTLIIEPIPIPRTITEPIPIMISRKTSIRSSKKRSSKKRSLRKSSKKRSSKKKSNRKRSTPKRKSSKKSLMRTRSASKRKSSKRKSSKRKSSKRK